MDIIQLKRSDVAAVVDCFLFENVQADVVEAALRDDRCVLIAAEAGTLLSDVYDYSGCLGLVLDGVIVVAKDDNFTMLRRGGMFGAAGIFGDKASDTPAELRAGANCRIVLFSGELLHDTMKSEFTVAENYLRFLTGRVRKLGEKIRSLTYSRTDMALIDYLVASAAGEEGHVTIRLGDGITALANELDVSRASLYRAFALLERDGYIEKYGRRIEVIDIKSLERLQKR